MIKKFGFAVLLAAAVVLGGVYWFVAMRPVSLGKGYQAVFLSNGQVYFGHLKNPASGNPVLTDVYYLTRKQSPQAAAGEETASEGEIGVGTGGSQLGFDLWRLGDAEIHGPENKMVLNRQHILFIENLREDSKVAQTIKESKAQPQK